MDKTKVPASANRQTLVALPPAASYDSDFYIWTQEQARLLRQQRPAGLDWTNVAEEMESLGKRDRRGLQNRFIVLTTHLLKWQYQPERRSRSWHSTITEQRRRLLVILEDSPSLQGYLGEQWLPLYSGARNKASLETGIETMPGDPPFDLEFTLHGKLER